MSEQDYIEKFELNVPKTFFDKLSSSEREFIKQCACTYLFSFQELKRVCEMALDFAMWGEVPLAKVWQNLETTLQINPQAQIIQRKKKLLALLEAHYTKLVTEAKNYPCQPENIFKQEPLEFEEIESEQNIFGDCPVCSDRTVCCGLKTLDAVQNCGFACSYCTIQTFYGDERKIRFVKDLKTKLAKLHLEQDKFYHIGTGQSSDSLMWGNRYGLLEALLDFAKRNPQVLLEFKTKSANVDYFETHAIPSNVVASWSLNTEKVINNEEHFSATLTARLEAARRFANLGGKVAFHFHPMVYYAGCEVEYAELAKQVQQLFKPAEIAFISYGTLTFIKPVVQQIRKRALPTKILQMPLDTDPHGKLTYPLELKLKLFRAIDAIFSAWHNEVFFYLCMERSEVWDGLWGTHFENRNEFLERFKALLKH